MTICVAPTEITIHPYRDKIVKATKDYVCQFTTNASRYVDTIADSLARGGKIFSSLDAGTAKTFQKIKGVDMFNKVCNNLKCYAEAGEVEVKYIFLPGVNDNEEDVTGFIQACKNINPSAIHISRDINNYGKPLEVHTLDMIANMISKGNEQGLRVNCSPLVFTSAEYDYIQNIGNYSVVQKKICTDSELVVQYRGVMKPPRKVVRRRRKEG